MNVEHIIAKTLINEALRRGWKVTVNDGEEDVLHLATDFNAIWAVMHSTDEQYLIFYDKDGTRLGWVWLIYGNGEDLISDHSMHKEMHDIVATTQNTVEA